MRSSRSSGWRAIAAVASLCLGFLLTRLYSSALGVLSPVLAADLGLAADELGTIAGSFFFAFAAMQVANGVLLDRYGTRYVTPSLLLIGAVGALLFASSRSGIGLFAGYMLVGVGVSSTFMGALVVVSRFFPLDRLAMIASMLYAVGGAGQILSATPLALLAEAAGWRAAFLIGAGFSVIAAAVIYLAVPDDRAEPDTKLATMARGLREVLRNANFVPIFALSLVAFAAVGTLRSLWLGPYLVQVHGTGPAETGNVALLMTAGIILGTLSYGPLDRVFNRRKPLVVGGAGLTMAALFALAASGNSSLAVAATLLFAVGFFGGYEVVLVAHGRASYPQRLAGRSLTAFNIATFAGAALMQVLTGALVDALGAHFDLARETTYRIVFALLGVATLVGVLLYSTARDVPPRTPGSPEEA